MSKEIDEALVLAHRAIDRADGESLTESGVNTIIVCRALITAIAERDQWKATAMEIDQKATVEFGRVLAAESRAETAEKSLASSLAGEGRRGGHP